MTREGGCPLYPAIVEPGGVDLGERQGDQRLCDPLGLAGVNEKEDRALCSSLKCQPRLGRGTLGPHHAANCRESMRPAEFSAASHTACWIHPPRSGTLGTRPVLQATRVRRLPHTSVINRMTMAARTDTYAAVVEALIEDREGLPVGAAVVQVAIRTVKGCQLLVDPPEGYRVGRGGAFRPGSPFAVPGFRNAKPPAHLHDRGIGARLGDYTVVLSVDEHVPVDH